MRRAYETLQLSCHRSVQLEEFPGVLPALSQFVVAVGEERSGLLDQPGGDSQVDEVSFFADAVAEEYVEFRNPKWQSYLVLDDTRLYPGADHLGPLLDGIGAPQVDSNRTVELQRSSSGGHLGIAEDDANLLSELIDEHDRCPGAVDG